MCVQKLIVFKFRERGSTPVVTWESDNFRSCSQFGARVQLALFLSLFISPSSQMQPSDPEAPVAGQDPPVLVEQPGMRHRGPVIDQPQDQQQQQQNQREKEEKEAAEAEKSEREKKKERANSAVLRWFCYVVYAVVAHMLGVFPQQVPGDIRLFSPLLCACGIEPVYVFISIAMQSKKVHPYDGADSGGGVGSANAGGAAAPTVPIWKQILLFAAADGFFYIHFSAHLLSGVIGFFYTPEKNFLPAAAAFPLWYIILVVKNRILHPKDQKPL